MKSGGSGPDDGTYADPERVEADHPGAAAASGPRARSPRRRSAVPGLAVVALLLGMGLAVYTLGDSPSGLPEGHPPISATVPTLDEAKLAELTSRVEANPGDTVSLRAIAEEYSRVGQYADSAVWQAKIVELEPDNVDARLILGVAYFNDGQLDAAETQWLRAAELAPKSPDPWYNLGFLYLSRSTPDFAQVEAAWTKVIELAPDSDIAKTARNHLDRLGGPSLSPSPSPTPTK